MRTLTTQELEQAGGGILPLIGFGLALAGKLGGSAGVAGWAVGSASLVLATYEAANYLGNLNNSQQ